MNEYDDASLRRSTRKRKLKRDNDIDYDYDYHKTEFQSFPSESIQLAYNDEQFVPKQTVAKKVKRSQPSKVLETVEYQDVEVANYEEVDNNLEKSLEEEKNVEDSYNGNNNAVRPERKVLSKERKLFITNSVVKLHPAHLAQMEDAEIIDFHCDNLIHRLETVAYSYLESWNVPYPVFYAPRAFLGSDASDYTTIESDEIAVKKTVETMVKAIAFLEK